MNNTLAGLVSTNGYRLVLTRYQVVPSGTDWYQLGTKCYQVVLSGTDWYQLVLTWY